MRRVMIAAGLVAWGALASAQDAARPASDPTAAVRTAFAEYRTARKTADDEKGAAKRAKLNEQAVVAFQRFCAQFETVDWSALDVAADEDLLWHGLQHASRANDTGDFALARRALEFLLSRPKDEQVGYDFELNRLPSVYAALGALDDGVAFLAGCRDGLGYADSALASFGMCDLLAIKSDVDGAAKCRKDAASALEIAVSRNETPRLLAKMMLQRRAFVGQKMADLEGIDSATGRPFRLSSTAGKPALCLVFSLFGEPEPAPFRLVAAAQEKCARGGLAVVGITSFDLVSPMTKVNSAVDTKMPRGPDDDTGEPVKVSRDGFPKYVEAVRLRVRASFPFVVAPENSLAAYADEFLRDTAILLDEQGRIVMNADRSELKYVPLMAKALCDRIAASKVAAPK